MKTTPILPKLTAPQLNLLGLIVGTPGGRHVVSYYPPGIVLRRLGLAEYSGNQLIATVKGRERFADEPKTT